MLSQKCVFSCVVMRSAAETSEECMMCMEMEAVILFQPCGHRIVCHECSVRMKKCFLCHEPISNKVDRRLSGMLVPQMYTFNILDTGP